MDDHISAAGRPQGQTSISVAASVQKEAQRQAYIESSELQMVISSLQAMASQLQQQIDRSKQEKSQEADAGILSTAPPPAAMQTLPTSAIADVSQLSPPAAAMASNFVQNPAQTEARMQLLLDSTRLDNAAQQIGSVGTALHTILQSNVNPETMQANLTALLPQAQNAINQLNTGLQTAAPATGDSTLQGAQNSLKSAAGQLSAKLPMPNSAQDLQNMQNTFQEQLQSRTSELAYLRLQHAKVANQVGGSLQTVMAPGQGGGVGAVGAAAAPASPAGANITPNPFSEIWKWILGGSGLMSDIGKKLQSLTKILYGQSKVMQAFSKMLSIFEKFHGWGIPSHFNPSIDPNAPSNWNSFIKDINAVRNNKTQWEKELNVVKGLIASMEGYEGKISGLSKLIGSLSAACDGMSKGLHKFYYFGMAKLSGSWAFFASNEATRLITVTVNGKRTKEKVASYFGWTIKTFTVKTGKKKYWVKPIKGVESQVHKVVNSLNSNMDKFNRIVKDGGSSIQSMQSQTQSQVKLYMLYYQQIMQTAPSLVQTLAQLIQAVAANMKGGQ